MGDTDEPDRHNGIFQPAGSSLPWQNILLSGASIAAVGAVAVWLNGWTGFPFGRWQAGPRGELWPLHINPTWSVPVSVVALLSARGVAKLLLGRWRKSRHYGYWLLGLNALLGTLPLAGLDLLATRATHWWHWEDSAWQWQGIALPNFASWLLVSIAALLLATPALIDKRPVQRLPGLRPFAVWFALNAACVVGCLPQASTAAVAALAAPVLVVAILALHQYRLAVVDCSEPPARQ